MVAPPDDSRGGKGSSPYAVPAGCGLKMPYNWDFDLLAKLGEINRDPRTKYPIIEVFAAKKFSILGSGRTASTTYDMTRSLKKYVEEAHRHGIRFEYLWNAITIGGKEWDTDFRINSTWRPRPWLKRGLTG